MNTVKCKKEGGTKFESKVFSDTINDMMMTKEKPQMTALQQEGMNSNKEVLDQYKDQKKFQNKFKILRVNLEAIRESKPDSIVSERTDSTVDYYENMVQVIQGKTEEIKQSAERQILNIQQALERSLNTQQRKLSFAEDKLTKAKERKGKVKKSKEEIRMEKQIQELVIDFKRTNPDRDLEYYFPGYKVLLGSNFNPSSSEPLPTSPPSTETFKNLVFEPEPEPEQEVEPEPKEKDFSEMTPWERFEFVNKSKHPYTIYQEAKACGIDPPIEEPPKPTIKRRVKSSTSKETISRDDLAKFLPNFV